MDSLRKLDVKPGDTWLMRNGKQVVIPTVTDTNGDFPFVSGQDSWMVTGKFWSETVDHSKDLIRKVE
ncbi:hypothetical protein SAMN05216327_101226 [Dyadobacter sp. SG02]|uniref:hypothetical protein n=1 Tax=Dyadobacter sp. SG02 TaxID=1855291 RepID=UPI0008C7FCD8|nr:hypothetical protein [Dyadobacter sp. SG02]SEI39765.1 hypothetical protein SAMN05216327_101226 [Dyadobacter sp. SG02]